MGFVKEEVKIVGIFKTKNLEALFDTGAVRNYIKREFYDGDTVESIGYDTYGGEQNVITADMRIVKGEKIKFKELLIKSLSEKEPEFVLMNDLLADVIIGVSLMQKLYLCPDPTIEKIILRR